MVPLSSVVLSVALAGAVPSTPEQSALMVVLRLCLDGVRLHRVPAVSGCAMHDASELVGVSRAAVFGVLGQPTFCISSGHHFFPWSSAECRGHVDVGYSFYWLPDGHTGDGPKLVFRFDSSDVVKTARWTNTNDVP